MACPAGAVDAAAGTCVPEAMGAVVALGFGVSKYAPSIMPGELSFAKEKLKLPKMPNLPDHVYKVPESNF